MDRLTQQAVLLFSLLVFYCFPFVLIFILSCVDIVTSPGSRLTATGTLFKVVVVVSTDPGTYMNIIHQMIMPTVAALTAANSDSLSMRGFIKWMFIIPLITIFVCILDALIFSIQPNFSEKGVVTQFFVSAASNLAIYVMLLVGLRMAEPKTP